MSLLAIRQDGRTRSFNTKFEKIIRFWTFFMVGALCFVLIRFHYQTTSSTIGRIFVEPLNTTSRPHIVSALGLRCKDGICTTRINGDLLTIPYTRVGDYTCQAEYRGQSVICENKAMSNQRLNGLKYEPTFRLYVDEIKGSIFHAAVPMWQLISLVIFVVLGWLLVPILWTIYFIRIYWRHQQWQSATKRVILLSVSLIGLVAVEPILFRLLLAFLHTIAVLS